METIVPLLDIIRRLRGKDGCEWDQKQTPLTMWKCLAEETYELEEAIVNQDLENIIEELGDVLFQVLFILEIYTRNKDFRFSEVIDGVAQKMIRRHPHVYGDSDIDSEEALNRQWEKIKCQEKKQAGKGGRPSALDGVPKGMPGLLRALMVSKSAVKAGFEWENIDQILETAKSEISEFEAALEKGDKDESMMEFGDILFSLVNVARFAGFHPETALYRSTSKFEGRFRTMEAALKKERQDLKKMSLDQKEAHWQRAKQAYDR
ncbi:MAG: nucleoside triphosphate pyrophosphohydrolase [Desulfobacter sp.]|nr:nucleoside triphosphate pyrophosphohydrolase [Desulfobacter sp.]WDP87106.1 MAG: nucleoside triphosphate pyrophosphohydrolase [Desulfobacter sp.]